MAKMRYYRLYHAGGRDFGGLYATCITKACKAFIETLSDPAHYVLWSRDHASIRYDHNHNVMGDYVIMEA